MTLRAQAPRSIDLQQVRGVLSEHCFACHGPDGAGREADLRLDRPLDEDRADELRRRILSEDPELRMPPPAAFPEGLAVGDREALVAWLDAGHPLAEHWSFVPPSRPALPSVGASGSAHPVDRFVDEALATAGLVPEPVADRFALARRASLDLVGLPCAPEVADALAAATRTDAFERFLDRLLAAPGYAERQARHWLDLARYADTNGYEKDRPRSIWPYRDWVIRAFDADLPYDRFVVEQLAGDLLPDATVDQHIATGFHRNTMLNEEGGIDPREFRYHAVADRVATTGAVFLGLTLGCAQCHSHKFDPVSQTEYFGLWAFLNNADEPDLELPDPAADQRDAARHAAALEELDRLDQQWPSDAEPFEQRFAGWFDRQVAAAVGWRTARPVELQSEQLRLVVEPDGAVFASGDTTKHDVYRLRFAASEVPVGALRFEALPDPRLPGNGPGTSYFEGPKGAFFLTELQVRGGGRDWSLAGFAVSNAKPADGAAVAQREVVFDGDLQTGWADEGRRGERSVAVALLREPIPAGTAFELELHFGRHYPSSLGRFRIATAATASPEAATDLDDELVAALADPVRRWSEEVRTGLRRVFLLGHAPEIGKQAEALRGRLRRSGRTTTLVFRERPADHPRPTHRHHRGEYGQPRELVEPQVPSALHAWPEGQPRDRLGFARWLVADDDPLFDRVVVNRVWARLFGHGLVRTPDDFGVMGQRPTHPELLDWLAIEFRHRGRSLKELHRLLMTSAAYQRRAETADATRAADPDNRWLARAERPRLEGEVIRDAALQAAGMLSPRRFGPPVRPPQPDGITEIAFGRPKWNAGEGEDRRRRSLYTFQKRTAPYALFQTFDAPSGEACMVRRDRSNTPLQALSLLNDPQMLEIARGFGARLHGVCRAQGVMEAVTEGFRSLLTRPPEAREREALVVFLEAQREHYTNDPEAVRAALGEGADPDSEAAAWTALARALLALDEAVSRS